MTFGSSYQEFCKIRNSTFFYQKVVTVVILSSLSSLELFASGNRIFVSGL